MSTEFLGREVDVIPAFEPDGLLPPGTHECNYPELRTALAFSEKRVRLLDGLSRLLNTLPDKSPIQSILIDGSFVQDKTDPSDLDLVIVLDSIRDGSRGQLLLAHVSHRFVSFKATFGCDAHVATADQGLEFWHNLYSHSKTNKEKGLLRIGPKGGLY